MRTEAMRKSLLSLTLMLLPITAQAEVSDKIILPYMMIIYALVLGALSVFINKKWPLYLPLTIIISCALASGGLATVYDTHIGPAAIKEQGQSYILFAYFELLTVLIANLIGGYLGFKARNKRHA